MVGGGRGYPPEGHGPRGAHGGRPLPGPSPWWRVWGRKSWREGDQEPLGVLGALVVCRGYPLPTPHVRTQKPKCTYTIQRGPSFIGEAGKGSDIARLPRNPFKPKRQTLANKTQCLSMEVRSNRGERADQTGVGVDLPDTPGRIPNPQPPTPDLPRGRPWRTHNPQTAGGWPRVVPEGIRLQPGATPPPRGPNTTCQRCSQWFWYGKKTRDRFDRRRVSDER